MSEDLLDNVEKKVALLQLVDILLAASYDRRINDGEDNCESAWTISKLSSSCAWLTVTPLDRNLTSSGPRIIGLGRNSIRAKSHHVPFRSVVAGCTSRPARLLHVAEGGQSGRPAGALACAGAV
jgi:hypothetical protein